MPSISLRDDIGNFLFLGKLNVNMENNTTVTTKIVDIGGNSSYSTFEHNKLIGVTTYSIRDVNTF